MPADTTAALKIAQEALKPASGVIDALLSPKVKRLKQWAAERDRRHMLDSSGLATSIEAYLQRLLRKVSGVTTMVFPQRVLPLPSLYEPITLLEHPIGYSVASVRGRSQEVAETVSEREVTRPGACVCIIDVAGMGKSTYVRHLVMDEIVNRDRIPILLELRRLPAAESLIDALRDELGQVHQPFDDSIFRLLLVEGRLLLVLDGLDEVEPSLRTRLVGEIEDLVTRAERLAIVLTTRPEVSLPRIPGIRLLTFAPLKLEQTTSLIRRYDRLAGIAVGEQLIERLTGIPEPFVQTPLLVTLLYRTFGYNGSVSDRITAFYDELYSALYKGHDFTKSGFARSKDSGLVVDDFRRLVRGLAFVMLARQATTFDSESVALASIEEAVDIAGVKPASSHAFLCDLLLAVPLLVRDGPEVRFAHRTILEFFAAEFLAVSQDGKELVGDICAVESIAPYLGALEFLRELNPQLWQAEVEGPVARRYLSWHPEVEDDLMRTIAFAIPGISIRRGDHFGGGDRPRRHQVTFHDAAAEEKMSFAFGSDAEIDQIVLAVAHASGEPIETDSHRYGSIALWSLLPATGEEISILDPRLRHPDILPSIQRMCRVLLRHYIARAPKPLGVGPSARVLTNAWANDSLARVDAARVAEERVRRLFKARPVKN